MTEWNKLGKKKQSTYWVTPYIYIYVKFEKMQIICGERKKER